MLCRQLLERVCRVGDAGTLHLYHAELDAAVLLRQQPRHGRTVTCGRELGALLEVRVARRHQQQPGQAQGVEHPARQGQVPVVRRVEGAAQHRQGLAPCALHACFGRCQVQGYSLTWPLPISTNFVLVSSRRPMGPRAWSFWVEMPISAPRPNSPPSVKRVEALA